MGHEMLRRSVVLAATVIVVGGLLAVFLATRESGRQYALPGEVCWDANNPSVLEPLMPDGNELDARILPLEPIVVGKPKGDDSSICAYTVDGKETIDVLVRATARMGDPGDPKNHLGTRVKDVSGLPFRGAAAMSDTTKGEPENGGTVVKAVTPCGASMAPYLGIWFHVTEYANSDTEARKAATVRLMKQLVPAVKITLKCSR